MTRIKMLLFTLLLSTPLFAQQQFTMTPTSGPVTGGTEVTITGDFGSWPYSFDFGRVPAQSFRRVDDRTFIVVTPPHPPGTTDVGIFEYDMYLENDLKFTFEGEAVEAFERVLLPIYTPPVYGAFGSEFRSELQATLKSGDGATLHGLKPTCILSACPEVDPIVSFSPSAPDLGSVDHTGNPGLFIYGTSSDLDRLSMNLRVYDVSRASENFGTELPVVRQRDFIGGFKPIVLLGVPSKPLFRNTLRIYGTFATPVVVEIIGANTNITRELTLRESTNTFEPAYAQFSDFPQTDVGPLRVVIRVPVPPISAPIAPDVWAFVSVTNNDTQLITTITPQP